jgi:hypothetical protein
MTFSIITSFWLLNSHNCYFFRLLPLELKIVKYFLAVRDVPSLYQEDIQVWVKAKKKACGVKGELLFEGEGLRFL